ncbi:hypothetical protein [Acetivibrio saccincola]|uniref:hypothetical protein n=1 Tax=Acetivibrio saccincola TaxID=1677857 RepID=UPI0016956B0C|nr:hypothetical protein [Acetivibrio saccincola]NLW27373.1 hypothetical protein [Acetivibrio saccincola]
MKGNGVKIFILCLILALLYGLIYYQFLWTARLDPKIEDLNKQLQEVKREKEILDRDLANLETIKRNIEILNVQDERFDSYLMNESNVADSIEYIDNLDRLFGNRFRNVTFKRPVRVTSKEKQRVYYEFGFNFNATLSLAEVMNLIDYLEGASKKVSIPKFTIRESTNTNLQSNDEEPENNIKMYDVDMSINLYALNIGNADKIYEYSQKRFNRVHDEDEMISAPFIGMTIEPGIIDRTVIDRVITPVGGSSTAAAPAFVENINISLYSFLSGGHNFVITNKQDGKIISFKTKITPDVTLTFYGDYVDVKVVGDAGNVRTLNGAITSDVINLSVLTKFPTDVKENENLGLSIQVINDSQKPIRVQLDDKSRRAKLLDRNGNTIKRNSQIENLRVI